MFFSALLSWWKSKEMKYKKTQIRIRKQKLVLLWEILFIPDDRTHGKLEYKFKCIEGQHSQW